MEKALNLNDLPRTLPQTYETEAAVLSVLINENSRIEDCESLVPECFSDDTHRMVYAEAVRQINVGHCDVVSLYHALRDSVTLQALNDIASSYAPVRSHKANVNRLLEAWKTRKLHALSYAIADLALEDAPINDRIDRAVSQLSTLADASDAEEWVSAHETAIRHIDVIERRETGVSHGTPTGIYDLDEMLDGGINPGNLVVIGARPSVGKSAIGLCMALHIAQTKTVGFISMEMSREEIADRQIAVLSHVPLSHIKRPNKGLEYDRVVDGIERSKALKLYVVERGGLNILQVKAKAKALKRAHGLEVLVLDYIGLMSGLDPKASRAYQIEEISRGLKTMAKELGIAIICLAQVNRGAAEKGNTPPSLHELRDSGAIEQDADVVMFLHRPIVANPALGNEWHHYALLRVAKNRQGRVGDVNLFYEGEQTRFSSWAGDPPQAPTTKRSGSFE